MCLNSMQCRCIKNPSDSVVSAFQAVWTSAKMPEIHTADPLQFVAPSLADISTTSISKCLMCPQKCHLCCSNCHYHTPNSLKELQEPLFDKSLQVILGLMPLLYIVGTRHGSACENQGLRVAMSREEMGIIDQ